MWVDSTPEVSWWLFPPSKWARRDPKRPPLTPPRSRLRLCLDLVVLLSAQQVDPKGDEATCGPPVIPTVGRNCNGWWLFLWRTPPVPTVTMLSFSKFPFVYLSNANSEELTVLTSLLNANPRKCPDPLIYMSFFKSSGGWWQCDTVDG